MPNEVYDGSQNQTNDWVHQLDNLDQSHAGICAPGQSDYKSVTGTKSSTDMSTCTELIARTNTDSVVLTSTDCNFLFFLTARKYVDICCDNL